MSKKPMFSRLLKLTQNPEHIYWKKQKWYFGSGKAKADKA